MKKNFKNEILKQALYDQGRGLAISAHMYVMQLESRNPTRVL